MQLEIPFAERLVPALPPFTPPTSGEADVPIPWLLQNLTYSVDTGSLESPGEWFYMMHDKTDYDLGNLIPAVEEDGQLDPIVIFPRSYDEDIPGRGYGMGNGHHRLVLGILRGDDTLRVHFANDGDYYVARISDAHSGAKYDHGSDQHLSNMLRESLRDGMVETGYDPYRCNCGCEDEDEDYEAA
jgi:hypothetical protein